VARNLDGQKGRQADQGVGRDEDPAMDRAEERVRGSVFVGDRRRRSE